MKKTRHFLKILPKFLLVIFLFCIIWGTDLKKNIPPKENGSLISENDMNSSIVVFFLQKAHLAVNKIYTHLLNHRPLFDLFV